LLLWGDITLRGDGSLFVGCGGGFGDGTCGGCSGRFLHGGFCDISVQKEEVELGQRVGVGLSRVINCKPDHLISFKLFLEFNALWHSNTAFTYLFLSFIKKLTFH